MTRLCIILLFLLTLLPSQAETSREPMQSLTIYDGLAGESVYRIFKSRWNVMWLATTNGVTSYDGVQTKSYRVGPDRSRNRVNDIAQAEDGFIWVATVDGLYKVDGTKEWLVRTLPDIKGDVKAVRIIGNSVYVGASDGLYISSTKYDNASTLHVWLSRNHLPGNNVVNDIIVEGNILWLLSNHELYRYDTSTHKVQSMNIRGSIHLNNTMRMMTKAGNRIFIGTFNDGIFVYDIVKKNITSYLDVNCRVITSLSVDKDNLYVGTDGAGLNVISLARNTITERYTTSPASRYMLKDNTVYAFYHDPSGVNFFGYYRQGLQHNYYRRELFHAYKYKDLFDSKGVNIRSICIDGCIKVLGGRGGLYYIDENRGIRKFFSPDELGGSIVTNVVKYAGKYYCCTFNGGVMRIDPQTLTTSRFGKSDALRNSSFGCLKVSPDNELWMAGNAGVYIYNAMKDTERHYDNHNSRLPDCYCDNLLFDRQQRCWISTAQGIFLYDPVDNTIHANDFPTGFFNMQRETQGTLGNKDNLLFYSLDGLFMTNEEMSVFKKIESSTPTLSECISQVIYDKRHRNYWLATETGMFRFDENMANMTKYATEAGLDSREFSSMAIFIDDRNTLWTGTMNGLFYCNLDKVERFSLGHAPIVLDNVIIGANLADDKEITRLLREKKVSLTYHWGTTKFIFRPVMLNYCNQNGLCFEYRIGRDGEWQQRRGDEDVIISGLAIGHSVLQIRLAGSENITEYNFYVWPSMWFVLEWIAIIVVIMSVIFSYLQYKAAKRQKEERERVEEELMEAKKKYARVNTNELEQQRLYRQLDQYMTQDKPYLSPDLKLSDIAAYLGFSTVKLSQLLNVTLNKNYYDFVNAYRLEEFKQRLTMPKYKNYTLMALAEECGFRRSSFFTTFKKMENMTPTEYVNKMTNDTTAENIKLKRS